MKFFCCFLIFHICIIANAFAVNGNIDTIPKVNSIVKKIPHNPKLAMKRSLMVPGWGQIYNKQIWKVPLIYIGLGITGYIFVDNLKTYNDIRFAFNARYNARVNLDSSGLSKIKDYLKPLDEGSLALNRRKFRQQVDYSVLFFVAFWGLNVADAIVFGHLKDFDVSDDLSGTVKFGNSSIANNTGVQLNLHLKNTKNKKLFVVK